MTDTDDTVATTIARARVRDGDKLFVAARYSDGYVSICQLALRPGFDGSGTSDWEKPRDEHGAVVAHATRATWGDDHVLRAAPADGSEDDHVPFAVLVRPAVAALLSTGLSGRWRGTWSGEVR